MIAGHMDFGLDVAVHERVPSPDVLVLPPAQQWGGKPLLEALKDRRSVREFSDRALPVEVLSNLLWAAFGVNRPETRGHTALSSAPPKASPPWCAAWWIARRSRR